MIDTALVLVDFQEERTDPDSEYYLWNISPTIQKVNFLIDYCRSREYKIIFTKHNEPGSIKDFWLNSRLIPEIKYQEWDIVVTKNKISPFYETNLEEILSDTRKIIICWILTNLCVRSFIEEAYDRDFHIIMIKDCCIAQRPEVHNFTVQDLQETRDEIEFLNLEDLVE